MTAVVVSHMESVFTANLDQFAKGATVVETTQKRIDGKKTTAKIDADATKATKALAEVEDATKRIATADTVTQVDADVAKAEKNLAAVDASRAALDGSKATVDVEADTSRAEGELDGLADKAEAAGADGGERAGTALGTKILAAVATVPIVGAVVGIGKAITDSLLEGFDSEATGDLFGARTGLDEATTARLGRAAGEAYAENFGASTAANLDTARNAIASGLLDPAATARDAEAVITSLSAVSDILEEDIPRVSRSASQILKTGLAQDAAGAFDLIVKGQQAGLNVSEDLLDTFDEYGTQFRKLGLEGPQALGLLNQAVKAGARDTDVAADALKEFSIRAIDDSELTAEGFEAVGLSAEEMSSAIAKGGPDAARALERTLDGLRDIKDPADRSAAAVALFGTQAEDLGDALFKMDLSNAVKQLGDVEGAADKAINRLGSNTKDDLEAATRDIDLAATQIKTSLAVAFGDDISQAADFVSNNREAVVDFLFDAADGAVDFGIALVEAAAAGTEALGDFAGSTLPAILDGLDAVVQGLGHVGLVSDEDAQKFADFTDESKKNLKDFDESTEDTAATIRKALIEDTLEPVQDKLGKLRIPAEAAARLSDTTGKLTGDIESLGYASDGSKLALKLMNGQVDTSTKAGGLLDKQIRRVKGALVDQVSAAAAAGEGQKSLRNRVQLARDAFIAQMEAMGLTRGQAKSLADQYGLIPKKVVTDVTANTAAARSNVESLVDYINGLNATITVYDRHVSSGLPGSRQGGITRAGGGSVTGPGTATSDSIPALLSNGEHVLTADEVVKAGGQSAIYRLRQMLRAGMARFATGGAVESQRNRVSQARRFVNQATENVHDARKDLQNAKTAAQERRAEDRLEDAEKRLAKRRENLDNQQAKLDRLEEETTSTRRSLRRGEFTGDIGTVDELFERSEDMDLSRRQRRNLASTAIEAERALAKLDKQSASLAKNMEKATTKASELRDISDGVASNLSGEQQLANAFTTTTNPWSGAETRSITAASIVAGAKETLSRMRSFAAKLKALAKAGLRGKILEEIAGEGSVDGIAIADALLSDVGSIDDLNATYASLDAVTGQAGQAVTEGYAKGGVALAEALVKSLEKQQAKLDAQYERQGRIMGKAIAQSIGIKARANGGPVAAGRPYLVNEDTPNSELFVPGQSGYVLNKQQMAALGGGPHKVVYVNVTQNYPQAIPFSKAVNKALQHAAEEVV